MVLKVFEVFPPLDSSTLHIFIFVLLGSDGRTWKMCQTKTLLL